MKTNLTLREKQVVFLVCLGYQMKEIARKLHIEPFTAMTYIDRVCKRLNIASRKEMIRHPTIRKFFREWEASEHTLFSNENEKG